MKDDFNAYKWFRDQHLNENELTEAPSMEATQIARDIINDIDFEDKFPYALSDEKLFLDVIKALNTQLYEKAADMFSTRAGASPDEY